MRTLVKKKKKIETIKMDQTEILCPTEPKIFRALWDISLLLQQLYSVLVV